ncbi:MAG: hypothetical protein EBZ69_01480 [Alphaproteobacteria bacterium]|nr:hypothetical protein [Alphaproteobacteria bacterium]
MSHHQPGDTFYAQDGVAKKPSSAQEEYYRYKFMKEKYGEGLLDKLRSDEDDVRRKTLEKIAGLSTSSPEFAQLASFFKTTNKLEIAQKLADDLYYRELHKNILQTYAPNKGDVLETILRSETTSEEFRKKRREELAKKVPPRSSAGTAFSGIR